MASSYVIKKITSLTEAGNILKVIKKTFKFKISKKLPDLLTIRQWNPTVRYTINFIFTEHVVYN